MNKPKEYSTDNVKELNVIPSTQLPMRFSSQEIYQSQLSHLISMAKMKGVKEYAWFRAIELDKMDLFRGIKADLIKAMKNEIR
jgi:hypothetical protein